jgi:hypothetical protein
MGDIEFRKERIRIDTSRYRITGELTLPRDGYRSRVSDFVNASERDFLVLTNVIVEPLDRGNTESHRFLAVARSQIVFLVSEDAAPSE